MITFDEVFTLDHLFTCAKACCKGVRWKCSTQLFEIEMPCWVHNLYKDLHNGKYKSKGFTEFDILERGKHRHIKAVHISERCVQKCLCRYYLIPLLTPKLIFDNSANVKGRGTDFAIKRLKQQLVHHYRKYGRQGGVLIMDYHDYFGTINHKILLGMLRNDIQDDRLFSLVEMFVGCFDGEIGLGLGSEVSQILAVYYVNKIDHFVKERLRIKGYGRYMDDSIIIHEDINYLYECEKAIRDYSAQFGLTLNSRTVIVPLTHGFTYLKKRFRITETGKILIKISRKNITKERQKIKKHASKGIDGSQSHQCWRGFALHYNSYNTVNNMDELYCDLNNIDFYNYIA